MYAFLPLRACLLVSAPVMLLTSCMPFSEGRRLEGEIATLREELGRVRQADARETARRFQVVDEQLDRATLLFERNGAELGLGVERLADRVERIEGRVQNVSRAQSALLSRAQRDRELADARLQALAAAVVEGGAASSPADAMFDDAQRRLAEGRWGDARRLFNEFLSRWGGDARAERARLSVAETLAKEGQWAAAIAGYAGVMSANREPGIEEETMWRAAEAFVELGRCDDARVWLKELLRRYPRARTRREVRDLASRLAVGRGGPRGCRPSPPSRS